MEKSSWIALSALVLGSAISGACGGGGDDGGGSGGAVSGGSGGTVSATGGKSAVGGSSPATGGKSAVGGSSSGGDAGSAAGGFGGEAGSPGTGGGAPVRPDCQDIPSIEEDDGFAVTVEGFDQCEPIPSEHTCEAKPFPEGTSPAMSWTEGPEGTMSYAVVFKDIAILAITDPGEMAYNRGYHWAMWDIPEDTRELPEELGEGYNSEDVDGAVQWANFKDYSFFGPCPNFDPDMPTDFNDTYAFVVYALPVAEAEIPSITGSTVRAMDDYFKSIALAVTEYRGTSDAHSSEIPAGVLPPTAVAPCPSEGEGPEDCLEKE